MTDGKNSDRSFKFVLTFLTAVSTIVYASYYYLRTSTLHESLFFPVMALITTLLIFSFFLITYVLIRGCFYVVEDNRKSNNQGWVIILNELVTGFYPTMFLIWISLSIYVIIAIILVSVARPSPFFDIISGFSIYPLLVSLFIVAWCLLHGLQNFIGFLFKLIKNKNFIRYVFNKCKNFIGFLFKLIKNKNFIRYVFNKCKNFIGFLFKLIKNKKSITIMSLLLFTLAWNFSYIPISVLFQGHVEIHMDNNTYYKDSAPIHVSIEITGRDVDSNISLNNSSEEIDKITLGPSHKVETGKKQILFGSAFSSGRYDIFIDTANPNVTEGYYELVFSRPDMTSKILIPYPYMSVGKKYGKAFYLSNNRTS